MLVDVFVFEGSAADEIAYYNPSLALFEILESYDHHAVAFEAAAPAVVAVFFVDFARGYKLEVAVRADVVVAAVAAETVEAESRGWDGV